MFRAKVSTAGLAIFAMTATVGVLGAGSPATQFASVQKTLGSSATVQVPHARRCHLVDEKHHRTKSGKCPRGLAAGSTVYHSAGEVDYYSAWPEYTRSGPTPTPDSLTVAYTKFDTDFLTPFPEQWGDGYIDGDFLVIQTVTRSVAAAKTLLKADGISLKGVKVVRSSLSRAEVQRIQNRVLPKDPTVGKHISVVAVDPKTGFVLVGIWANDHKLRRYLHCLHVGKVIAFFEGQMRW